MTEAVTKKTRGQNMTNPILESLCKEKHKAIDEKLTNIFHTQDEFYDSLSGMTSFVATQTQLSADIIKQLEKIDSRIKALEDVPKMRWNQAINIVMQFAILLALGLIVAKIGL